MTRRKWIAIVILIPALALVVLRLLVRSVNVRPQAELAQCKQNLRRIWSDFERQMSNTSNAELNLPRALKTAMRFTGANCPCGKDNYLALQQSIVYPPTGGDVPLRDRAILICERRMSHIFSESDVVPSLEGAVNMIASDGYVYDWHGRQDDWDEVVERLLRDPGFNTLGQVWDREMAGRGREM